ncbi:MAG: hypothetical protein M3144_03760 [Actinomycetota bacterium]|nr:hypothetical protein [Actinomycetota bacterium]
MAGSLIEKLRGKTPQELAQAVVHRVPPIRATYRAYHKARYWDPMWYHVLNRAGKAEQAKRSIVLDAVQQHALDTLRAEGICQLSISDLFGDDDLLGRLQEEAARALAQPEVVSQVNSGMARTDEKHFLVRALGGVPLVDPGSELAMLPLNDKILDIVTAYLGLSPRLRAFDLWYTLPVDAAQPPILSQCWHRDYDDHRLVKMFLYLVDVDESMGPFSYVRGTHSRGEYASVLPTSPPRGSNPPDGAVEALIPATQVLRCTGKAGTMILCDTNGFHQGGRSTSDPRLLLMANYASDAANAPYLLRLGDPESYRNLSPAAKFALRLQ